MLLERPAPGRPDTRTPGARSADEAGSAGEAFEGFRRRLAHGLGGQPGRGAAEGAQGCREGKGEEAGRSWELVVEVWVQPLPRLLGLPLWTRAMAAGLRETVVWATAWAGLKTVAVGPGATGADSLHGFEGCQRPVGGAGEVLCAIGVEEGGARGHDGTPCMPVWMRWTAAAWPLWGRWRASLVVASRAWPLELGMARRLTPASSRCVAEPWRRGGMPPSRCMMLARCWAWRKAPGTLRRCMGAVAGVMGF